MCISEFSKVLMYKFDYDLIRDKYDNKPITTNITYRH